MKKKAFTLIELLVVIAIIAILASLAIPALTAAIEKGRAISDAANMKQVGLGIRQYLNENDDDFFPASGGTHTWPDLVKVYVPDRKVFQSPFDGRKPTATDPYNVSYGINNGLFGINYSKFTNPSQLIILAPAMVPGGTAVTFAETSSTNVAVQQGAGSGEFRSRKQINALFSDMHASAMSMTLYSDTGSTEGARRWKYDAP